MADYLTQPSSKEGSISKITKIRSELKRQKDEVSKQREKFAKRTLGLEAGIAIGNSALKGALDRYQLRNQPELNLLKAQKQQALDFITQDNEAMKKHGSVDNNIFHQLKNRYQDEVNLKAGEDYVYSSDHWSDELNTDVAEKTKAYKDYLAASRNISEGNIDQAFAGLKEQALPSNMWDWFTRSSKQLVKGHDATTIKLKADGSFDKLINNDTFAAHKDFQAQAKIYNSLNPGGLQKVLSEIDKDKQVRYSKISLDSRVMDHEKTEMIGDQKVQVKSYKLVTRAIREQAGTGKVDEVIVSERDYDGGVIPQEIITAQQLNAFNTALSVEGKAKLAQLLEQDAYILDPSKAYLEVVRLGNEKGRGDGSMINSYLAPDIDLDLIREKLTLAIGQDISALLRIPRMEDYQHIKDSTRRQEKFQLDLDNYNKTKQSYAKTVADAVNDIANSMIQSNVIPPLPKP